MLKLTMDYKMTKHMPNNGTLNESRTWLLVRTWRCYFISFNSEHPVGETQRTFQRCQFTGLYKHRLIYILHSLYLPSKFRTATRSPMAVRGQGLSCQSVQVSSTGISFEKCPNAPLGTAAGCLIG